jgi:hypothetical protein
LEKTNRRIVKVRNLVAIVAIYWKLFQKSKIKPGIYWREIVHIQGWELKKYPYSLHVQKSLLAFLSKSFSSSDKES